jgi:hypothetical protein
VPVNCQPAAARSDGDSTWAGTIRDLSRGGLGLILERRFEPGTVLFIELPGLDGRTLLARVANITRLPQGSWLLGCAFSSKLGDEEVQRLVRGQGGQEGPAEGESPEQGVMIPGVILEGRVGTGGRVVRRVVRWLKLPGAWPPPPGTLLSVGIEGRVINPAGDRVRVLGCTTREDGSWVLTYEFVGQPSPEVLHRLGYRKAADR